MARRQLAGARGVRHVRHPLRKEFPVEGIDTGSAIYPEYYEEGQGPISGSGTGWKPKQPAAETEAEAAPEAKGGKPEETS